MERQEKSVLLDPPAVREQRFDLARMMADIEREANEPPELDCYNVGGTTTGVFEKWHEDSTVLGSMCNWLIKCARYYLHEQTPPARKQRCLDVMSDFVDRYDQAIGIPKPYRFPWGNNWYEFSITSSLMLFYYMLCVQHNLEWMAQAIDLTLRIVITPKRSLGWKRTEANSVYMALPWIVAHYFHGDVNEAAGHPDYAYVMDYTQLSFVQKRGNVGLYMDYTYITHIDCLAYGYLAEMVRMSKPIFSFDNHMNNFLVQWKCIQRLLLHPMIPYGPIGFYSRDKRTTAPTNDDSPLGVRVIPTCLFLRMYHENYSFAVRGQNEWIAYYESDMTNDDMAQYWVQYRGVRFADQKHEATFPDVGFFYAEKNLCRHMITERCCIWTRSATTTTFKPRKWPTKQIRFAFAYDHIGMLRHSYNCAEMVYNYCRDPDYGGFTVEEYILCDYSKHTVDSWIHIRKKKQYTMLLVAETTHVWQRDTPKQGIFHISWDCGKRELASSLELGTSINDKIAEHYPLGIKIVQTDNNAVMLLENDRPKLAMYPDDCENILKRFRTKYAGKEYEFEFNEQMNQYCYNGIDLCVDNIVPA